VAAIAELLRPGGSTAAARRQFSAWYLYLPVKDGLTMRGHVELYEAWLARAGRAHTPQVFREWVAREYRPGYPSREDWPFDPYPLVVISRPASAAESADGDAGVIEVGGTGRSLAR
jgi:hypothetical protein